MTPVEKADELVKRMYAVRSNSASDITLYFAKQCALIAVDEILQNFGNLTDGKQHYCAYATIQYYKEVKQEIEKL